MELVIAENKVLNKEKILGQFFTKETVIENLLNILFKYKPYDQSIRILEPSFGTGNFIKVLSRKGFYNIDGCEIDETLAEKAEDFFDYPIEEKYDLIIGNPPFTKYNIKESYYYPKDYLSSPCSPFKYLPGRTATKEKEKIENVFILKSLKHLKDSDSTIAFILPISFFIKNKNIAIKKEILNKFSTIIIYQDRETWFDYNLPCCFSIFTNILDFKNSLILLYDNEVNHSEIIGLDNFFEEIIPEVFYNKKHGLTNNHKGNPLRDYLSTETVKYKMSYKNYNVSGSNILERGKIPLEKDADDYRLAIVRVGNASVGRCGLIDVRNDVLNGMFFVFDFIKQYSKDRQFKEKICELINANPDYFRNITCRIGSKSIKKEDVFNFNVDLSGSFL